MELKNYNLDSLLLTLENISSNYPAGSAESGMLEYAAKGIIFIESEGLSLPFRQFINSSELSSEQEAKLRALGITPEEGIGNDEV